MEENINKNLKESLYTNIFRDIDKQTEIGEIFIYHYKPKFESNFDVGCVFVFYRGLFTYKCLEKEQIVQFNKEIGKQAASIIRKFKDKYSLEKVYLGSLR